MKKTTIAGVSAILAALPVAGVFAASGTTVTDTVQITIATACSMSATNLENTYSSNMTNSQLKSDFGSTTMNISCNNAGGWKLSAIGSGADATDKTAMNATGSGTDIATGTATSGATSNWAMKLTGAGGANITTGYGSFTEVPASTTKVASGNGAVSGAKVSTTYQVWVSATQQADTYTGQVTYTLSNPNA